MAEEVGFCEYCQSSGAIGKDVFLEEKVDGIETYICVKCDNERIRDMEEDKINFSCSCGGNDPDCGHPNCSGYLS